MKTLPAIDTWVRRTNDSDMPFLVVGYEPDWSGKMCVMARPLIWGFDLSEWPMMLCPETLESYE